MISLQLVVDWIMSTPSGMSSPVYAKGRETVRTALFECMVGLLKIGRAEKSLCSLNQHVSLFFPCFICVHVPTTYTKENIYRRQMRKNICFDELVYGYNKTCILLFLIKKSTFLLREKKNA